MEAVGLSDDGGGEWRRSHEDGDGGVSHVYVEGGIPLLLNEERYASLAYLVASHGFYRCSEILGREIVWCFELGKRIYNIIESNSNPTYPYICNVRVLSYATLGYSHIHSPIKFSLKSLHLSKVQIQDMSIAFSNVILLPHEIFCSRESCPMEIDLKKARRRGRANAKLPLKKGKSSLEEKE
ncbi:hypothetical protein ACFE04_011786 [Oxalis oulophora]